MVKAIYTILAAAFILGEWNQALAQNTSNGRITQPQTTRQNAGMTQSTQHQGNAGPTLPTLNELRLRQVFPDIPNVGVWLEVRDPGGAAVTGLTSKDFTANIGDKPLEVKRLMPLSQTGGDTAYILLIDRSESMAKNRVFKSAVSVGKNLIDQLGERDKMSVASFGESFVLELEKGKFTSDKALLTSALEQIEADDSKTCLYDSLYGLLSILEETAKDPGFPKKKIIVILSDGKNDGGQKSLEDVSKMVVQLQVPLFSVGFASRSFRSFPQMSRLSKESGGRHLVENSPGAITAAFDEFKKRLDEGYFLEMTCADCRPGANQEPLAVRLTGAKPVQIATEMFQSDEAKRKEEEAKAAKQNAAAQKIEEERLAAEAVAKQQAEKKRKYYLVVGIVAAAALVLVMMTIIIRRKRRSAPIENLSASEDVPLGRENPASEERSYDKRGPISLGTAPPFKPIHLHKIGGEGVLDPNGPYSITPAGLTLGRNGEIRQIGDESVSSNHCRFQLEGDVVTVEDLGSTNGTYRNGSKVDSRERLQDGDELKIGTTRFRVELEH